MNQEERPIGGQNLPVHSEDNNDVDLSISAKRERIEEEAKGEREVEMHHYPQEIATAGMDQKDLQIRQLMQKVASLEGENLQIKEQNAQMHEKNGQLQNELKEKDEVIDKWDEFEWELEEKNK